MRHLRLNKIIISAGLLLLLMMIFVIHSISLIDFSLYEKRSKILLSEDNHILAYTLSEDEALRFKTTKEDVSPLYLKMLLSSEDLHFYKHFGVDVLALMRSLYKNIVHQKVVQGGSTLAMQLSKRLMGHTHERSYLNKLREIIGAVYLTLIYGRDEVLTMYLTTLPCGSNIEGVRACALSWFQKEAYALTPSEAALLVALPRSPEKLRPDRHKTKSFLYKNAVLKLAYEHDIINADMYQASITVPVEPKLNPIKQYAYTLGTHLFYKKRKSLSKMMVEQREYHTNISYHLQEKLHEVVHFFENKKVDSGVLSIVVIDGIKHEIKGLIGSSNLKESSLCLPFYLRSPGSTLKPFAYGFAFDEEKLHPKTILHDNKTLYGLWSPQNFDYSYHGLVSAENALRYSLNLPALEVMKLITPEHFLSRLNSFQKRLYSQHNRPDLTMVLGSASISLYDLTILYAMLNEDGRLFHYSLFKKDTAQPPNTNTYVNFMHEDSARAVFNILKETPRPYNYPDEYEISYKTGTSYRFNDALAIGTLGGYTAGVSISRPNNRPGNYNYSGYKDAAPLLFEILKGLPPTIKHKPYLDSLLLKNNVPDILREHKSNQILSLHHNKLKIDFPKDDMQVSPDAYGRIFVKTTGGSGKIYYSLDGEQQQEASFLVDKEGYYTICVLDEQGNSDCVKFYVLLTKPKR